MMRRVGWLGVLLLGCGGATEGGAEGVMKSAGEGPIVVAQATPGSRVTDGKAKPAVGEALADLGTQKKGTDWPRFLGPTGDGKSSETGLVLPIPEAGPRVVWHCETGAGYPAPTISRGRLYEFSRFGADNRLSCRNSETGELLWKFEYPTDYEDRYGYDNGPRCCPVVDGDRVYLHGPEGMLFCLSADAGREIWKLDTQRTFGFVQNFFGVGSTPVIEKDLLIVQVGGSVPGSELVPFEQIESNETAVVALDKLTGQVRYKLGKDLASYASPVLTTIGDRRWGFAFCRTGLIGFDPQQGTQDFFYHWRAPILESVNASNPVVVGDEVLISETYGPGASLLKVKPGAAEVVWADSPLARDKNLQTHWNTSIAVDGYVYGSSGRHSGNAELRCVEWATGKVMWSQPGLARCSLTLVDGHFICLSEYGPVLIVKVDHEKFDRVGTFMVRDEGGRDLLEYPCWAAPVLSHGLLYLRGEGRLVCLDLIPE